MTGKRAVWLGTGLAVAVAAAVIFVVVRQTTFPSTTASGPGSANPTSPAEPGSASKAESPPPGDGSAAGGTGQGQRAGAAVAGQKTPGDKVADPHFDYGKTVPVKGDANPQVRSVAEALRDKNHPERLSPLVQPKPFDAAAYKANPSAYLAVVEPGRVFQTLQPGKDVPRLRPLSPQLQEVAQGESVTLRVQTVPNGVASFTSFDLGKFQNELTAITVQADDKGVAEVKFYGTPGTINEVKILAGSPMASGQIQFIVNVVR